MEDAINQDPKYPDVAVQLSGGSGDAGSIMGSIARGLQRAGIDSSEINEFRRECMSGDYDNLLRTAMKWVSIS